MGLCHSEIISPSSEQSLNGITPQDPHQEVYDPNDDHGVLDDSEKPLHPLPRGLVELYGLLAVLIVLVPEWLANTAMENLDFSRGQPLALRSKSWQWDPELMLGAMTMEQLRQLAKRQGLWGYSREHRDRLVRRLLRHFRKKSNSRRLLQQDGSPTKPGV